MPVALDVDWDMVKLLFCQGVKPEVIAKRFGIKPATLRTRASRQGWSAQAAESQEILAKTTPTDLKEQGREHLQTMSSIVRNKLAYLAKINPASLSTSELREIAACEELYDRIARRTYDLDSQGDRQTFVGVNLTVVNLGPQPTATDDATRCIDVASEPQE